MTLPQTTHWRLRGLTSVNWLSTFSVLTLFQLGVQSSLLSHAALFSFSIHPVCENGITNTSFLRIAVFCSLKLKQRRIRSPKCNALYIRTKTEETIRTTGNPRNLPYQSISAKRTRSITPTRTIYHQRHWNILTQDPPQAKLISNQTTFTLIARL